MAWYAIVLAGGSGSRMGAECNKVLLPLDGEPILCRSVEAFRGLVEGIVLVARAEDMSACRSLMSRWGLAGLIRAYAPGGMDRQASVRNGLEALPDHCDKVLVHDAARAMVTPEVIRRVMDSVELCGTGVASVKVVDTIKRVDRGEKVIDTPERAQLRAVQTPQGFTTALLRKAHLQAQIDGYRGTDDASLVERLGVAVQLTEGSEDNFKLTTPRDLFWAETLLERKRERRAPTLRVGQGYDVHRLVEGRRLILCGVQIPHTLGLLGHSDADVALHALMDAMLGAMALGDIGKHFPDTDDAYAGADSMALLARVVALLEAHHARVANCDITIVAQKPKLLPHIPQMRENVARVLGLETGCVNVKATTTEQLGFEGAQEGISAQAVCMVQVE